MSGSTSRSARESPLRDAQAVVGQRMAELAASLAESSAHGSPDPEDTRSMELIREHMSQIFALPGGATALVERYGGDERVAVVRPLAFQLALAVNDRDGASALAAIVFAMLDRIRIDDPWARLNLCTAVQRLLMFGAVTALEARAASALIRLLRTSLAGIPPLRATAATVIADLFYGRHTVLPAAELATLRDALLALVDDPDELTRKEAQGLRDFLADPNRGAT